MRAQFIKSRGPSIGGRARHRTAGVALRRAAARGAVRNALALRAPCGSAIAPSHRLGPPRPRVDEGRWRLPTIPACLARTVLAPDREEVPRMQDRLDGGCSASLS